MSASLETFEIFSVPQNLQIAVNRFYSIKKCLIAFKLSGNSEILNRLELFFKIKPKGSDFK